MDKGALLMSKYTMSFSEISCIGGCAKKISPLDLSSLLSKMPNVIDENVFLSYGDFEDVSAYKINENTLIVQTIDFMPPVTTDPYIYGQIAVANALSDVYAKGVKPLFALSILTYPLKTSLKEDVEKIIIGGADKANEAGIFIIGGHSIDGDEPYYGLTVTGMSTTSEMITNSNARAGDMLILTKPLGSGAILNGYRYKLLEQSVLSKAVDVMRTLNKTASELMVSVGVNAATDITGYGLLGHLYEMMQASKVSALISYADIPFMANVFDINEVDALPIASRKNWEYVDSSLDISVDINEFQKLLLTDPQTSGGLLISVPKEKHRKLIDLFVDNNVFAATIGEVTDGKSGCIKIV